MIDLLIIIGIASVFFNFAGFVIDVFGDFKRKKAYEHEDSVTSGYISEYEGIGIVGTMNNQIVYKVNGDFNGDIKGDNVTVILMGNGNFNGDISSKDGEVVLIKGSINGDVKANKIVCPTEPTNKVRPNCRMCKCYMCEGVITGQIYCYKHGLLNDPVPCSNFVKGDQL